MTEPKVMICLPTAEMARRADFYDYMDMLTLPPNTMKTKSHGQSPARNRNLMIRIALQNNATHCFFLDDDVSFAPDILLRLLAHDKDIVSGLYLMRNYPHLPIMFDESYEDGRCRFSFLKPGMKGLVPAVNFGLGCALIKTDVFRKMAEGEDLDKFCWITLGEAEKDHWCDDISFFNRARKLGYELFVDLEAKCGHAVNMYIWPHQDADGKWYTKYDTTSKEAPIIPQVNPTDEEIRQSLERAGLK